MTLTLDIETLQIEGGDMSEPNATPAPDKQALAINLPLTTEQKLTLMSIQRKMLAKQIASTNLQKEIEQLARGLQEELGKITLTNRIDPTAFTLDDDLNLVLNLVAITK